MTDWLEGEIRVLTVDSIGERYRRYLIPLPDKPYDTAEVVYRTVNTEGMVPYRQNFYSVPWRHLGQVLPLRITEAELIVYGPNLEEVAPHRLLPRSATGFRENLAQPAFDGAIFAARGFSATGFDRAVFSGAGFAGRYRSNLSSTLRG